MKAKLVIFDLDGTLADTSVGILNSHRHTHEAMGKPVPSDRKMYQAIGAPLPESYRRLFGFSREETEQAVRLYREYYASHGVHEASVYPGVPELLRKLKDENVHMSVATLKAETFAREMLNELRLLPFFDVVFGADATDTRSKAKLISLCMEHVGVSPAESLLIGDSAYDAMGAKQAGLPFVGVTYGFGFGRDTDISKVDALLLTDDCKEIYEWILRS